MKKETIAMLEKEMMEESRLDLIKTIETIESSTVIGRLRAIVQSYISTIKKEEAAPTDQDEELH